MTLWTAVRDDINGTYCAKPRTEYFSAYPLTKTVLLRVLTFLHVYIKCKLCVWKLDSNRLTTNTMSIQNFHFNLNKLGRHVHPLSDASKCFAICWAWSKVLPTQLQKVITLKKDALATKKYAIRWHWMHYLRILSWDWKSGSHFWMITWSMGRIKTL